MKKTLSVLWMFMLLLPSVVRAQHEDAVYFIPPKVDMSARYAARDSANNVLYQQALVALDSRCFTIKFDTYESPTGRSVFDNRYHFMELNGEKLSYQDGYLYEGKASDINMEEDESGNLCYTMQMDVPNRFRSMLARIVVKKGTNKCSVYFKRKYGREANGYNEGIIYPLGTADVIKNITLFKNH